MIKIIPAISIIDGKCARLTEGRKENIVFYEESPLDLAKKFEDHGFSRLHLIDLDGAVKGRVINAHILEMIAGYTNLEIDFTGGISSSSDIVKAFENGARRVVSARMAIHDPEEFLSWLISYGRSKIILGADFYDGKIVTDGWLKDTQTDLFDHIEFYYQRSISYVKCTDTSRDGLLEGPSFDLYKDIVERFPGIRILASGGIRSVEDVEMLQQIGVYGVIFNRAYYEGKIKLKEFEKFLVSQGP